VTASIRGSRFNFIGGTSSGQTVSDNCGVRADLPELSTGAMGTSSFGAGLMNSAVTPTSPYCHVASGILTQFKAAGSYLLPWGDVQVSTAIQSRPGPMLVANWEAPNAAVAPSLGRPLSGNASNVTVNLVTPGTMYGPRINEVDLRVAKLLRHGDSRTMLAVDLYNLMNASAGLAYNPAFTAGAPWPMATAIQTARFIRFTAEFTF
jgi:hypothetical protein